MNLYQINQENMMDAEMISLLEDQAQSDGLARLHELELHFSSMLAEIQRYRNHYQNASSANDQAEILGYAIHHASTNNGVRLDLLAKAAGDLRVVATMREGAEQ